MGPLPGMTTFHEFPESDLSGNIFSARSERGYGANFTIMVDVIPFSDLPAQIDFLKCNIEGAEYALVEQGLFKRVDAFVMEVHNAHCPNGRGRFRQLEEMLAMLHDEFELHQRGPLKHRWSILTGKRIVSPDAH